MKKFVSFRNVVGSVLELEKESNIHPIFKKSVKKALFAVQSQTGIKVNPKIIYLKSYKDNYAAYYGLSKKKKKPKIILYVESFYECESIEKMQKEIILSVIHEYLHYIVQRKKLYRLLSREEEEELVEAMTTKIYTNYFI